MASFIQWFQAHSAMVFGILFGVSEALAQIPSVQANSVFQLVFGWLKKQQPQASPPSQG